MFESLYLTCIFHFNNLQSSTALLLIDSLITGLKNSYSNQIPQANLGKVALDSLTVIAIIMPFFYNMD
ncbi:MAG: hypothetical protein DRP47_00375 [Candidatus Zixiibacteriota bacterium]|nr:MAG: hypothetical protein DRP47_00375 [candidate division Zixibacteria bacterium]